VKIAFFSHTAMGGAFVVGSHHLARALRLLGHDVTHVSAPISPAHFIVAMRDKFVRERVRRWLRGGVTIGGVKDLTPFTLLPWRLARSSAWLSGNYSKSMLAGPMRRFLLARGHNPACCLIVDEPRFAGLIAAHPGCNIIYRATDLYAVLRNDPKIVDAERLLCAHARVLVATSERVAAHLELLSGKPVHIITNGVDFEHFAAATDSTHPPGQFDLPGTRAQRAVYVGAFDRRLSRVAIESAARRLQDKRFILAGPGSLELAGELALPNVVALGAVAYSRLPALLKECAVGLLPLSGDAANEGRSPMKLYEYAAAGAAVAATRTAELERTRLPTLCIARAEDEFHLAVAVAFERSTDEGLVCETRELARQEGWQGKAAQLLSLVTAQIDVLPAQREPSSTDLHGVEAG
jgi:glycosyltransferase involved in cell wall biosynthesis